MKRAQEEGKFWGVLETPRRKRQNFLSVCRIGSEGSDSVGGTGWNIRQQDSGLTPATEVVGDGFQAQERPEA